MEAGDRGKLRNRTRVVKKSLSSHATMGSGKGPKMQSRGHTCNIERVSLYVLTFGRFRFDRSFVPKKLLFEFNLVVAGQT